MLATYSARTFGAHSCWLDHSAQYQMSSVEESIFEMLSHSRTFGFLLSKAWMHWGGGSLIVLTCKCFPYLRLLAPRKMMPQFLVLASIYFHLQVSFNFQVQSLINPAIAMTRLLLNLLCGESLCVTSSDEETWICAGADAGSRISINLNFPCFINVLLLNLAFCIWIYSTRISEVWKHNVDKNPICLSSCLLIMIVVLDHKMENRNKMISESRIVTIQEINTNPSRSDDGPNCKVYGLSPLLLERLRWASSNTESQDVQISVHLSLVAGRVSLGLCRIGKLINFSFLTSQLCCLHSKSKTPI
jgi:hypothetical protein